MRKFTLFILSLFFAITAVGQVADGVYTIDNIYGKRGTMSYGYYNDYECFGLLEILSYEYSDRGISIDNTSKKYWYVTTTDNGTYLFNIGRQYFLQDNNEIIATCDSNIGGCFTLKTSTVNNRSYVSVLDSRGYYLSYCCSLFPNEGQVRWYGNDEKEANLFTFNKVSNGETNYASIISSVNAKIAKYETEVSAAKDDLNSLIEQVSEWNNSGYIGDGVGQKSSSKENFIDEFNAVVDFYNNITITTPVNDIKAKTAELEALIATLSVNMPVDGKVYTIRNIHADGKAFVLKKGETELTMSSVEIGDDTEKFICRVIDAQSNKYAFLNISNCKFMIFHGIATTNPLAADNGAKTGFASSYNVLEQTECDLIVTSLDDNANASFGTFSIAGIRKLNSGGYGYATMTIANSGEMNANSGESAISNTASYSSLFTFEEVEYPNAPTLNAVGESPKLTEDLHNTTMATFSAPFATVVPESVTAYYATAGDGFVTLLPILATEAIPANTGVILVGTDTGSITMVPAAGETAADVTGNVLANTAGAAKELADGAGYILGASEGNAGFYKNNAGTLAMNKAYIALNGTNQSVEVRFPGTTGIEKVEMRNEKTVYDLQGRIVENPTAGIYIVNGKKVLVK